MLNFKTIIGLEIHVELKTKSKMFCSCCADYFQKPPNSLTCPICLGLPGALPKPNLEAIKKTILLGMALNCHIPQVAKFDRKNYFYPDLPKGYQISQYDMPFCLNGFMEISLDKGKINEENKKIRIKRVHLEEDTGKLSHQTGYSLIDFNRSGVPLAEIVSEPDIASSVEAKIFLQKLQLIITSLGVSDADMEKGQMRCEPTVNLELRAQNNKIIYTPLVEIKNINSFRFVQKAIDCEVKRQIEEYEKTKEIKKSGNKTTRGWDEEKQTTYLLRTKEEAMDYRYFTEPDIPAMVISSQLVNKVKEDLACFEMPEDKILRYQKVYGLSALAAETLCKDKKKEEYFKNVIAIVGKETNRNYIVNLIINKKYDWGNMQPEIFVEKMKESLNKEYLAPNDYEKILTQVIKQNPKPVEEYKKGKNNAVEFLLGISMRQSKGKIEPKVARAKLIELLENNNG